MDKEQVEYMMNHCTLPDSCNEQVLKETHISWVVLTDNFAFKIKRPVAFSFLDFSTPAKRKFYCQQELKLNRRLAPEMYLDVIPVTRKMAGLNENGDDDEVIDHAVKMKRMDNSLEMNKMLKEDKVTEQHIDKLAEKIARFHKKVRVLKNAFGTLEFQERFANIQSVSTWLAEKSGDFGWEAKINECVDKSFNYLNSIRNLSNHRVITGFQKNCHGDLNAGNIFLYDDPVIFDCIEFNSDYRRIDVLNDIAFLCVDLDFFNKHELSERFYNKYLEFYGLNDDTESRKLFTYYKSYRASIRAKVTLLHLQDNPDYESDIELEDAKKYILMMEEYLSDF
jgi:uncharacterized protein